MIGTMRLPMPSWRNSLVSNRTAAMVDAGLDVVFVDVAHAHTRDAAGTVSRIRQQRSSEVQVVAVNDLGDAKINIEALHGTSREQRSCVQFVPNEPHRAKSVLEASGIAFTEREVLVVRVLDEPGTLGDVALVMAHANINLASVYMTTSGHVVLGVDDLAGAVQVAGGMAVMAFD